MLIQNDQLSHMGRLLFVRRFRSLLHESFEDSRRIPREQLDAAILQQLREAERYGLRSEQSAATFVMAAWLLGPGFDATFPTVRERLNNPDLSEVQKALWLESFTISLLDTLERNK